MEAIQQLHAAAETIWNDYLAHGPGHPQPALYESLRRAKQNFDKSLQSESIEPELRQAITQVCELSERCCHRPEGLCFVTGEAGLIPQDELHQAFESALRKIQQACNRKPACPNGDQEHP